MTPTVHDCSRFDVDVPPTVSTRVVTLTSVASPTIHVSTKVPVASPTPSTMTTTASVDRLVSSIIGASTTLALVLQPVDAFAASTSASAICIVTHGSSTHSAVANELRVVHVDTRSRVSPAGIGTRKNISPEAWPK
jgi:hypothetical protein